MMMHIAVTDCNQHHMVFRNFSLLDDISFSSSFSSSDVSLVAGYYQCPAACQTIIVLATFHQKCVSSNYGYCDCSTGLNEMLFAGHTRLCQQTMY